MIMVSRRGGGRRYIARGYVSRRLRERAVESRQVLKRNHHRTHHVVVFVVENMAVPYVTRPCRRVKRECVLTGCQVCIVHKLRSQADQQSCDRERRDQDDVLPSVFARELAGGYRYTRHPWLGKIVCST